LNNEELNAKVFIANPENPSERIYNTGDLAKYQSGALYCLGRKDLQVRVAWLQRRCISVIELAITAPLIAS
jgi:non-ribosomal peptide synthetase component F